METPAVTLDKKDAASFDADMMREFEINAAEIARLRTFYNMPVIPGAEGFFSRVLASFTNHFRRFVNSLHVQFYAWEALLTQNWQRYAERYVKLLSENLPDAEQFTGVIALRSTKADCDKYRAALLSVVNLCKNLSSVILSSEKETLPSAMRNVIAYLEMNHCTVDPARPSKCKAATRFTFGELGRLGTAGFGSDPQVFLSHMRQYMEAWNHVYSVLLDKNNLDGAVRRMESEIEKLTLNMDKDASSRRMDIAERINVIRARMVAYRAIFQTAQDMWMTSAMTVFILPLQKMGMNAGVKEDLTSWILATKGE